MRKIAFFIVFCIALALTSCGRTQVTDETPNDNNNHSDRYEERRPGVVPAAQPVLTISVLASYCPNEQGQGTNISAIRAASHEMRMDWLQKGETFLLDMELIQWDDWHSWDMRNQRLSLQMMAGDMPDIILFNNQNIRAMAEQGFLVNFYDLIDQDPHLNRDDFFTQALSAFEMHGGLYMLPASFGFEYVRINCSLPGHITDEFSHKSFITVEEMLDLYLRLMTNYKDEFSHLSLGIPTSWNQNHFLRTFDDYSVTPLAFETSILFEAIASNFVNFGTQRADFTNPRFASNMETIHQIFEKDTAPRNFGNRITNPRTSDTTPAGGNFFYRIEDWMFFFYSEGGATMCDTCITTGSFPINHHIPLVDNEGRLLISPFPQRMGGSAWQSKVWANIGISAGADTEAAWEFVKHLLCAYAIQSTNSIATPILREYFYEQTLHSIDRWFDGLTPESHPTLVNQHYCIRSSTIQTLATFNEMPMTLLTTMMPRELYEENLDFFLRGAISTEDFIHQLQNIVALWLIE